MRFRVWLESTAVQSLLAEYHALTKPISQQIRNYHGVNIGLDVPNMQAHAIHPDSVYLYEIVASGGSGTNAMNMITQLLDKYQVILEGHVQPMADKRLNIDQLKAWYSRFGCQMVKQERAWDEDNLWHFVRMPKQLLPHPADQELPAS